MGLDYGFGLWVLQGMQPGIQNRWNQRCGSVTPRGTVPLANTVAGRHSGSVSNFSLYQANTCQLRTCQFLWTNKLLWYRVTPPHCELHRMNKARSSKLCLQRTIVSYFDTRTLSSCNNEAGLDGGSLVHKILLGPWSLLNSNLNIHCYVRHLITIYPMII